jgi:hypothetical protein
VRGGDGSLTLIKSKEVPMPIFQMIFILAVIGVIMYVLNKYVPMQATIKKVLNIAVVIFVIVWLAYTFGLIPNMANIRIGK